jgi:hypothetical protein
MISAKRKAESGPLATDDLVQQALRDEVARKQAKKQQKDPTGALLCIFKHRSALHCLAGAKLRLTCWRHAFNRSLHQEFAS